jgi:TRAP-type C4-dicarboxylate transport system permease small subunit
LIGFTSIQRYFSSPPALFWVLAVLLFAIYRYLVPAVIGEFAIVSFIWAVLMAIAWQVNTEGHLKITVFYGRMPSSMKRIFSLGFLFIIIFIGFVMVYEGIIYIDHTKSVKVTSLGYPRWITFYLPLPISGFGVMVFGIRRAIEFFKPASN